MTTRPCTSCAAPIGFIETPSGRAIPVDPELVKTFRALTAVTTNKVLVTERGVVTRFFEVTATYPEAEAIEGFVSHFATCSAPAAHRRARG